MCRGMHTVVLEGYQADREKKCLWWEKEWTNWVVQKRTSVEGDATTCRLRNEEVDESWIKEEFDQMIEEMVDKRRKAI